MLFGGNWFQCVGENDFITTLEIHAIRFLIVIRAAFTIDFTVSTVDDAALCKDCSYKSIMYFRHRLPYSTEIPFLTPPSAQGFTS